MVFFEPRKGPCYGNPYSGCGYVGCDGGLGRFVAFFSSVGCGLFLKDPKKLSDRQYLSHQPVYISFGMINAQRKPEPSSSRWNRRGANG
jgi:hypothetical protein